MKFKLPQVGPDLACEGELDAHTCGVRPKNDAKFFIDFRVNCSGKDYTVTREYATKLDPKNAAFKDFQTILGRPFSEAELAGEFDSASLDKLPCRVVVAHKRASGGKMTAVVTAVLPAS